MHSTYKQWEKELTKPMNKKTIAIEDVLDILVDEELASALRKRFQYLHQKQREAAAKNMISQRPEIGCKDFNEFEAGFNETVAKMDQHVDRVCSD